MFGPSTREPRVLNGMEARHVDADHAFVLRRQDQHAFVLRRQDQQLLESRIQGFRVPCPHVGHFVVNYEEFQASCSTESEGVLWMPITRSSSAGKNSTCVGVEG